MDNYFQFQIDSIDFLLRWEIVRILQKEKRSSKHWSSNVQQVYNNFTSIVYGCIELGFIGIIIILLSSSARLLLTTLQCMVPSAELIRGVVRQGVRELWQTTAHFWGAEHRGEISNFTAVAGSNPVDKWCLGQCLQMTLRLFYTWQIVEWYTRVTWEAPDSFAASMRGF